MFESDEHGVYLGVYVGALLAYELRLKMNQDEIEALRRNDQEFLKELADDLYWHREKYAGRTF
ncbi:hypothetical protein [Vulgatibacter incomptus]|uniref:hypothetical protein n=1 Tax=Vulgatibacter incomptus TaxID=1391653 RepID=UPI0012F8A9C2|nr:hypothetical protein [Vulgatibacter incomptus]